MSYKFNFNATFNADGYATVDKKFLTALNIRPHTTTTSTFQLTETLPKLRNIPKVIKEPVHHKNNPALTIEECKPDRDYREGHCIPLPSNVSHNSIFSNIISSFKHSFHAQREKEANQVKEKFRARKNMKKTNLYPQDPDVEDVNERIIRQLEEEEEKIAKRMEFENRLNQEKLDRKLNAWASFLKLPQNTYVLSDSFWYMKYHIVPEEQSQEVTEFLLERMARNYIDLFLTVSGTYKQSFFKNFFNILSQGVFYSFFYACPKSRDDLNDQMKEVFLTQFSILFTGIELSNPRGYFESWYLDLGAGNILKNNEESGETKEIPAIVFNNTVQLKVIRTKQDLRYSPVILTYLGAENYKTRNVVKGYKMSFSKIGADKDEVEKKFETYRQVAKKVNQDMQAFKEEDRLATLALKKDLKKMKEDAWQHQRRLSRRRDEELEKGAHEYANYLVSMLNANSQGVNAQKL